MTPEEHIADLEASLRAFQDANDRGGSWETHRAEVVIERELNRARAILNRADKKEC